MRGRRRCSTSCSSTTRRRGFAQSWRRRALRVYVRPMVPARVTSEGETKTLHVDVQPGDRGTQTRVRIQSTDPGLAGDLEARVAERNLAVDVLRNPGAVTRDLTDYLRSRGYLRASVKPAPPDRKS